MAMRDAPAKGAESLTLDRECRTARHPHDDPADRVGEQISFRTNAACDQVTGIFDVR